MYAIYAYIDPPKPPQLFGIYGIHGVFVFGIWGWSVQPGALVQKMRRTTDWVGRSYSAVLTCKHPGTQSNPCSAMSSTLTVQPFCRSAQAIEACPRNASHLMSSINISPHVHQTEYDAPGGIPDTTCLGLPCRTADQARPPSHHHHPGGRFEGSPVVPDVSCLGIRWSSAGPL